MQEIAPLVLWTHRSAEIPPQHDECGKADDEGHHPRPPVVRLPEHDCRPERHHQQRAEEGDVREEQPQLSPVDLGTEGSLAGSHTSMMAGRWHYRRPGREAGRTCRIVSVGLRQGGPYRRERPIPVANVLHWHTMAAGLDWLPDDGVLLTREDLERIFVALRALISGTAQLEPNRAYAVDIAVTITRALERNFGDD